LLTCSFAFFFSSRRRHTRLQGDWSSDVCSSDLGGNGTVVLHAGATMEVTGSQCTQRHQQGHTYPGGCLSLTPAFRNEGVVYLLRSEERRVGKECRSRWSPYH